MQIRMVHNGRDRDSLLMPIGASQPVGLMLQFRVRLVRCEPNMHFGTGRTFCNGNGILNDEGEAFHLDPWANEEWTAFSTHFTGVIARYWDGKFELAPNRPWYRQSGPQGPLEATPIRCNLSIAVQDSPARAHHQYFIFKPREESFRSFVQGRRGMFTHRDLSLDWNERRTRVGSARHNVGFLQSTILHEFGHTLGLGHVRGRGNDDAAYGVTLDQRHDVMGMGHHLTERAAQPWLSQLRHHLIRDNTRREDRELRFTARVVEPQLITYWDNDWVAPSPPAAH